MSHSLAQWREQYPILESKTYLASHSLGAVPRATRDALNEYHDLWATEGILAWDGPWWQAVLNYSATMERIIGAPEGTVVPMQNATRGMAAVASCFEYQAPRNRIVITSLEFTTSYPFWTSQQRLGAELVVIESRDGKTVDLEDFVNALDERVLLVPTSHVYFRSGALQDLATIIDAAHRHGAMVLGDGYQAVGTVPVHMETLDVDFYVGGSHKWLCGGPGAAFLYVRPDHVQRLQPRLTGWFGLKNPFGYDPRSAKPELSDGVHRFLGGTPNVPALYAAREGLRIIDTIGVEAIRRVSTAQTTQVIERADERGLTVHTPRNPNERSGMVCLDFPDAERVSHQLCEQGIVVDWRPDCGLRMSPHFYNTEEDTTRFFTAIDDALGTA